MELTTLCYIERGDEYLMLHRISKEKDINKGKWIGVGGHLEGEESPDECLLREVREETGLTLTDYRLRGLVTFISGRGMSQIMFLFTAGGFEGEQIPCDEGVLRWVRKEDVPALNLWEGDRIFLKLLLERTDVFLLKLVYDAEDRLIEAVLDGEALLRR